MSRYVKCEGCGKKCQASISGTCKECRAKAFRSLEKRCIFCNAEISWYSPGGNLKPPTKYAAQLFCSTVCSRRYTIENPGQKAAPNAVPVKKAEIEGNKYNGRISFDNEDDAMEFIKGLYRKGYEFMGDPNKEPKYSRHTGFYGIEYVRDFVSGRMYQSFFITTSPQVFKNYIRRTNDNEHGSI